MAKSRIQTLQNQVRILKEQTLALEEKGRHDDELVEALTGRLKSTKTTDSDPITSSSIAQLQSKESINEIKQLRQELSQQQTKYYELQGQLTQAKSQLSKVFIKLFN